MTFIYPDLALIASVVIASLLSATLQLNFNRLRRRLTQNAQFEIEPSAGWHSCETVQTTLDNYDWEPSARHSMNDGGG